MSDTRPTDENQATDPAPETTTAPDEVSPTVEAGDEAAAGSGGVGEAAAEASAPPPPPRRGGRGVAFLAAVALLVAGGSAGYLGYRVHLLEGELAALPAATEQRIDDAVAVVDVRDDVAAIERALAGLDEDQAAMHAALDDRIDALDEAVARVRDLATRDDVDWRLAEVRFLIRVGVYRLQLAADTASAAAAFEAADRALARLGDARLMPLREALIDDLVAIRAVEPPDIEGIALRLHNLHQRIGHLPLAAAEPEPGADEPAAERSYWEQLRARLRALVVVRHREAGPVDSLPADAAQLPAREALALTLFEARGAALAGDETRYARSLAAARALVDRHFATDAGRTDRFIADLDALAERRIQADLPDLMPTLELAADLTGRIAARRGPEPAPVPADDADANDERGED